MVMWSSAGVGGVGVLRSTDVGNQKRSAAVEKGQKSRPKDRLKIANEHFFQNSRPETVLH
jgi:hypothetical protein